MLVNLGWSFVTVFVISVVVYVSPSSAQCKGFWEDIQVIEKGSFN